ncbi:potassium channel family protein [Candidatus Magnetobacterium casense]|uniref:Two pore domain potassium channel family protein n=1 Tax=Candidatus Magnetobacterium casense TaxID=1455061 RepID=A0ABS6RXA4_9BACT|nr:potassium channel family protein [Candidatus Magnetobacterium casensis]MBV6341267.1 two pore domain potassium channel family protein [Candidatus Magnetobacterium casensis]
MKKSQCLDIVMFLLSPTQVCSSSLLEGRLNKLLSSFLSKTSKEQMIKKISTVAMIISVTSVVIFLIIDYFSMTESLLMIWYFFSRCNQLSYRFYIDAIDSLGNNNKKTSLTSQDRIKLSLKSYLELTINFSIIYWLLTSVWTDIKITRTPNNILDCLYFSGVTITTLGYGDIAPTHWILKVLTIYEVFCGLIILIVCFAIYLGHNTSISLDIKRR